MTESAPKENTNESREKIPSREEVVASLRLSSGERAIFNRYLKHREGEVARENSPEAGLLLTIELAEICHDAGLVHEAIELYEVALLQAEQRDEFSRIAERCRVELRKDL